MVATRVAVASLLLVSGSATPGWGGDCDLKVSGVDALKKPPKSPYSVDGIYTLCGSRTDGHDGERPVFCRETGDSNTPFQIQYQSPSDQLLPVKAEGWIISGFHGSVIFLQCKTKECLNASTPENLSGAGWEVDPNGDAHETGASLSISCCPSKPAKCGARPGHKACNDSECEKHKSFFSCLAASVFGCCQPWGMIDTGRCLCKRIRPTCTRSEDDRKAWPRDDFHTPWALRAAERQSKEANTQEDAVV